MKILLFGANGNLGEKITNGLNSRSLDLHTVSKSEFDIIFNDELSLKDILIRNNYDYVINCTALIGIMKCERERVNAYKINAKFIYQLTKYLNEDKTKIIHFSTADIFSCNSIEENHNENGSPCPTTWYGVTKLLGENFLSNYKNKLIIRLPLLFSLDIHNNKLTVNNLLNKLINNDGIEVFDDVFSTPIPIEMIEPILYDILRKKIDLDLIHISSDVNLSLYEFIKKLGSIMGLNINRIKPVSAANNVDLIKPRYGGLGSAELPLINHNDMLAYFKGE